VRLRGAQWRTRTERCMAAINPGRFAAEIEGDFVVFLIGARINSINVIASFLDLGGRRGMKHMLDHLMKDPEKGLLGYQMGIPTIVQYWRSFDHLEAFAKNQHDPHLQAWRNYWRRVGRSTRTGIWHDRAIHLSRLFFVRAYRARVVWRGGGPS
jgi:hypothetical protein